MASVAVVLAVGARLSGHASFGTLTSSTTLAAFASVRGEAACHHDERHAEPFEVRQEEHDFGRLAGIGEREHYVGARDHAEIAMPRFGGMQEERGRAGARKRGSNLAGDVPGLAHAGDDHAAFAGEAECGTRERSGRRSSAAVP